MRHIRLLFEKITTFYNEKIYKHLSKAWHRFTHNKVIMVTHTDIKFFSKIRLKITNKRRESVVGYMFILLWIIGYLIFSLYPVFYSLYLSFFMVGREATGLTLDYIGTGNYRAAFVIDPVFPEHLINYLVRILLNVPVTIVFALIIAMLLNQDIKGRGVWRTIFFLPVIISSGPVIQELINQGATTLPSISDYTFIEIVVENVGAFLANPLQALFAQILLVLWFAGIQILILLAGLQKIDKEIYEASMIDGASPWESFWKITLPSIMPLITVSIIYTVVSMSVFSLNEIIIYILNRMQAVSAPGVIIAGYGYSAAIAWIYFIFMSLIILVFIGAINIRKKRRT